MSARTHLRSGAMHRTLCGTSAVRVTETRQLVTCRHCKRMMQGLSDPSDWDWDRVVRYVADVLCGPAVETYPVTIASDEWRMMSCRMHGAALERCGCQWCAWERRWRGAVDDWQRSQSLRPHLRHQHPFGSIAAALSFYARWRRDGASLRSSTGSATARLEAVAKLGVEVQTTQRFDRDSLEVDRAGYAVIIEDCIAEALSDEQRRRGLAAATALAALLSSLDESDASHPAALAERVGLTERAMRGMLASTRRALTVDLAARGMIPEPRSQAGMGREIAARRAEIGRAA